jgi:hypothetical protein
VQQLQVIPELKQSAQKSSRIPSLAKAHNESGTSPWRVFPFRRNSSAQKENKKAEAMDVSVEWTEKRCNLKHLHELTKYFKVS